MTAEHASGSGCERAGGVYAPGGLELSGLTGGVTQPVNMVEPIIRGLFDPAFALGLLELTPTSPASARLDLGRNATGCVRGHDRRISR